MNDDTRDRCAAEHDMEGILRIERMCFDQPWDEMDFYPFLQVPGWVCKVADLGGQVVGYVTYHAQSDHLMLANLAVDPSMHRMGIGTQLIQDMKKKLHPKRRRNIMVVVRERNLPAQLFLRSMGFIATEILHDAFDEIVEDAYCMKYEMPSNCKETA